MLFIGLLGSVFRLVPRTQSPGMIVVPGEFSSSLDRKSGSIILDESQGKRQSCRVPGKARGR